MAPLLVMLAVALLTRPARAAAMFPANLRAAREHLPVAGRRATPLLWRLPLQLFWIAALWWVASAPSR